MRKDFRVHSCKQHVTIRVEVAVEKCDASRETQGIVARPYIYALNNKVVYEDMIRKAQQGSVEEEREAQKKYGEEITDKIEVDVNAPAEEM